jgi:hypothetical protein
VVDTANMTPAEPYACILLDAEFLYVVFVRAFGSSSSRPVTSPYSTEYGVFTQGKTDLQIAENKGVDRRKLPVTQQFPVGDDVKREILNLVLAKTGRPMWGTWIETA